MKIFKTIAIVVIVIIASFFLLAAFTPKEYAIVRKTTIQKNKEFVFDYLRFLKNQDNFSKWASMDTSMEKSFIGVDGQVGFISSWDSTRDDVRSGEQEIINIIENERIDYKLRFFEPFESEDDTWIEIVELSSEISSVQWGFEGSLKYPMNIMLLFMDFEGMIGDDLQHGLDELKFILENE